MNTQLDRRHFLAASALAAAAPLSIPATSPAPAETIELGLIVGADPDADAAIRKVHELGLPTCQVFVDDFGADAAARLRAALQRYAVRATAVATLGPGPKVWDFYQGPLTIGLLPRQWRQARVAALKQASDFARQLAIPAIHTHCGFLPENPNDPQYAEIIPVLRDVISHCRENGQTFLYETGQESPITLLRTLRDVGLDNQGVNLDTANLILYGKGNPVDALDVIGAYVRGLHAKDGLFPTDPRRLGEEVAIGQGRADFPSVIRKLRKLNYRGPMTIERETSGPQQIEDVRREKTYLEGLLRQIPPT